MFHVSTCLLSFDPYVVVTSSSYDVATTTYDDVVTTTSCRRRDDVVRRRRHDDVTTTYDDVVDVRRRRTYITGLSVTFLCKYLYVVLTLCCYTVNEFIYDVSRIYLLT